MAFVKGPLTCLNGAVTSSTVETGSGMECRSLLCKIHFTEAKYETNLQQVGVYCLGQVCLHRE